MMPTTRTRPVIYLAHVASQLISRWFDPFEVGADTFASDIVVNEGRPDCTDLFELTVADWRNVILDDYGLPRASLPWLVHYLGSKIGSISTLIQAAKRNLEFCEKFGGRPILLSDRNYPPLLRMIKDPPICLTALGNLSMLELPKVAVIGSRRACSRALLESASFGGILGSRGIAVVSGGAYGCDISAHRGVLEGKMATASAILVFAGGLGKLYPKGNQQTFRDIYQRGGLLLSERLWDQPSLPRDFPVRNRIVSGLARETIVMQAGKRSGAMITARLALDQGRDVSVLHFDYDDLAADGNLALMAEGAQSFLSATDWLETVCDYQELLSCEGDVVQH